VGDGSGRIRDSVGSGGDKVGEKGKSRQRFAGSGEVEACAVRTMKVNDALVLEIGAARCCYRYVSDGVCARNDAESRGMGYGIHVLCTSALLSSRKAGEAG